MNGEWSYEIYCLLCFSERKAVDKGHSPKQQNRLEAKKRPSHFSPDKRLINKYNNKDEDSSSLYQVSIIIEWIYLMLIVGSAKRQ